MNRKTLAIIVLFSLICAQAFAAGKKIKFHKPESEAERALDHILRVESNLMPNCTVREDGAIKCPKCNQRNNNVICEDFPYKNKLTKAFSVDEDRQQKEYEVLNPCQEGDMCAFVDVNILTGAQDIITDVGFLYYTKKYEDDIYIYVIVKGCKNCQDPYELDDRIVDINVVENLGVNYHIANYKMKKEDDKWKIDGVCHRDVKINHKRCWTRFSTHLF